MDVRMPEMDGIEATRRITDSLPETKVLMLTTFDLDEYVVAAFGAGASGFLLKTAPRDQLVAAVRTIHAGDALLAPVSTRRLIERFAAPARKRRSRGAHRAGAGRALAARARPLERRDRGRGVEPSTVKSHVASVLAKLDLRDRVQAVVYAYESGLVRPGLTAP